MPDGIKDDNKTPTNVNFIHFKVSLKIAQFLGFNMVKRRFGHRYGTGQGTGR